MSDLSLSRKSRRSLLAVAPHLALAARAIFALPDVVHAADMVDLARIRLEMNQRGRQEQGELRADLVEASLAAEEGLDRRCGALFRVLDGLADLGEGDAEILRDLLFPEGAGAFVTPRGRAQAPFFARLADQLEAHATNPALVRLAPLPAELVADLRVYVNNLTVKETAHLETSSSIASTQAATEALRAALQELDLRCQLAGGGPKGAGYLAWRARGAGLG